jgi:hypothetical protein
MKGRTRLLLGLACALLALVVVGVVLQAVRTSAVGSQLFPAPLASYANLAAGTHSLGDRRCPGRAALVEETTSNGTTPPHATFAGANQSARCR